MIIDASNQIVGRMATRVAKLALMGETIDIVNAEKAIITGRKEAVYQKYKRFSDMGHHVKGPFIHRSPDKFLRRIIRGMLPYKQPKGKDAYDRIKCHKSVPENMQGKSFESFKEASGNRLTTLNYVSVGQVCKHLGGR